MRVVPGRERRLMTAMFPLVRMMLAAPVFVMHMMLACLGSEMSAKVEMTVVCVGACAPFQSQKPHRPLHSSMQSCVAKVQTW